MRYLALLVLVSGCASMPTGDAARILEADEAMVASCKFLGSVYGKTLIGGAANDLAVNNAKTDALEKAAKLGATHVVYTNIDGGNWERKGSVTARAYGCPGAR